MFDGVIALLNNDAQQTLRWLLIATGARSSPMIPWRNYLTASITHFRGFQRPDELWIMASWLRYALEHDRVPHRHKLRYIPPECGSEIIRAVRVQRQSVSTLRMCTQHVFHQLYALELPQQVGMTTGFVERLSLDLKTGMLGASH